MRHLLNNNSTRVPFRTATGTSVLLAALCCLAAGWTANMAVPPARVPPGTPHEVTQRPQLRESAVTSASPQLADSQPGPPLQRAQQGRPGQTSPEPRNRRRPQYGPVNESQPQDEWPQWELAEQFEHDVFTFVRIQFDSFGRGGYNGGWRNDYPDCDLNFSYRLQELTSLQVDPKGRVLRLTDPSLFDHPFIFMSNLQQISLSAPETLALQRYLLSGGFLLADDFWTPAAWRHIQSVMEQVLPGRKPVELPYNHPIFHLIYDLPEIPRIPSIRAWQQGYTFEYWHGDPEGDEDPHFMGYFDDAGRLIAIFCYNNDVGDGFEREGENHEYFEKYSVQVSYPLGINIVMYALTH
ncbi:MAG: DUF4159 domain-containing protein [Planctomycetaceae bacterium]